MSDVCYINSLQRAIKWCTEQGISVDFKQRSGGLWESDETGKKLITVSASARPVTQLCLLLHEVGHYVLDTSNVHIQDRYRMGWASADDAVFRRTNKHRLAILEEEYEAWYKGWQIGILTGALTQFDADAFNDIKVKCLKTYVKWAGRSPGFTRYENDQ